MSTPAAASLISEETRAFYVRSMKALHTAQVPYLVGGAYAFARYTGIERHTKDFDIFVREHDQAGALEAFQKMGCETEPTFPHWLSKAFHGEDFVDIIFSAGNGVARVDEEWFEYALDGIVLGVPVKLIPAEEMIWSKGFIMERERFDGADVAHILRARSAEIDWGRLLRRFGGHHRVLLVHLLLFGFIYPSERNQIPAEVIRDLMGRVDAELDQNDRRNLCQGTLISRQQYLTDIQQWGYKDARQEPRGSMTREDIAHWTAAIETIK
jgi:hypothetical protein